VKDAEQLSADLDDRLSDVLAGEGEMVTRWGAVAEVIAPDGKRYLRTFWSDDLSRWDGIGMLTAAMDDLRAMRDREVTE
jgi:hypothetical protein